MPMINTLINRFNRGEVSPLALARVDLEGLPDMCELMTNMEPMSLGPMMYRPGMQNLGSLGGVSYFIPFVFGTDDAALIQFADAEMRVWVNDALVTRTTRTSAVTNGTFDSNLNDWTDADEGGSAASTWDSGGYMSLLGDGDNAAKRHQTITAEVDEKHGLRIIVEKAPIKLKLGTSGVDSTDIFEGDLDPGTHSLAFTPDSNFTITLSNEKNIEALVDSVAVESTGAMSIPIAVAEADLSKIRYAQSADVLFLACDGYPWFKIERRATESWSVVDYRPTDGPYNLINTTSLELTPGALTGDTTLTASSAFFSTDKHDGVLFKLESSGQEVTASITGDNQETGNIKVTGIGASRKFAVEITGTWTATITLQRSAGEPGSWEDVESYTTNQNKNFDDGLDSSIIYYRLACKSGDYTSGTAACSLNFTGGSISGQARVTSVTSATVAQVQVLEDFGKTDATVNWYQSEYSTDAGYPSGVALYEGRTWWGGKNKIAGSVSDLYDSFDNTLAVSERALRRTIGFGPVDSINFLAAGMRLIAGTAGSEISVRSSGFSEPLTATNINLKDTSTQGSANVDYAKLDRTIYYVHRSGTRVMELVQASEAEEYQPSDITSLHPEIALAGIKRIAVQKQPEMRLYAVLDDGVVLVNLMEPTENIRAWYRISLADSCTAEDVVVIPGTQEDQVYFVVNDSGTRYLTKRAKITECRGGTINKTFDLFETFTSPGTTFTVDHPDGTSVGVWADGQDRGDFTVASSQITVGGSWTDVVVGRRYTAQWKSPKLAYAAGKGTAIAQAKKVNQIAFVMKHYWPGSLQYGPTFSQLYDMPGFEEGDSVDTTAVTSDYDEPAMEFGGEWDTDPRVCLEVTGPCTLMACVLTVETHDK